MASLQFNDETDYQGLIQECERKLYNREYGRISDDSIELKTWTTYLNHGVDWVQTRIFKSDTRWQFDDANYGTYPNFTDDLVDNHNDYRLDVEHVKLHGVSIKNADGDYYALQPIDKNDYSGPLEEVYGTKGTPAYYDKVADAVRIYPAPDATKVTISEGIKVYVSRTMDYFTSTDTTQTPGIPSLFHEAVATPACYRFAVDNDIDTKAEKFLRDLQVWEDEITNYYAQRDVDDRPRMGVSYKRNLNRLR